MFQVDRKQQLVIIIIAAVILFTAGYRVSRWQGDQYRDPGKAENIVKAAGGEAGREIVVHVSGAVEKPGIYRFSKEMRVSDALDKAVPVAGADVQGLNLAAPLKDGQKIVVPLKQEPLPAGSQSVAAPPPAGGTVIQQKVPPTSGTPARVNINRATARELEDLPGLGPGLSQRIVSYREKKGLFTSEEDIKNVPGIGDKLYDQLKDYITVR